MAQLDLDELSQRYRLSLIPQEDPAEQAHRHRQEWLATLVRPGTSCAARVVRRRHGGADGLVLPGHSHGLRQRERCLARGDGGSAEVGHGHP